MEPPVAKKGRKGAKAKEHVAEELTQEQVQRFVFLSSIKIPLGCRSADSADFRGSTAMFLFSLNARLCRYCMIKN
jgi:hypothetical protein